MLNTDPFKRAIRPLLFEDRILAVEQKFFCDRTTEKTIVLTVKDNQNTPKELKNSTVRLSCQYPLSAVKDLSEFNEENKYDNSWIYVKTEETDCEESQCKNEKYENDANFALNDNKGNAQSFLIYCHFAGFTTWRVKIICN